MLALCLQINALSKFRHWILWHLTFSACCGCVLWFRSHEAAKGRTSGNSLNLSGLGLRCSLFHFSARPPQTHLREDFVFDYILAWVQKVFFSYVTNLFVSYCGPVCDKSGLVQEEFCLKTTSTCFLWHMWVTFNKFLCQTFKVYHLKGCWQTEFKYHWDKFHL